MPLGSSVSLFSRRTNTVALDIGSSHVKLLELERDRTGKYRLKNYGVAPLPPEAIVDGAFMNTTAIVGTIKDLLQKQKIKTKDAVVARRTRPGRWTCCWWRRARSWSTSTPAS